MNFNTNLTPTESSIVLYTTHVLSYSFKFCTRSLHLPKYAIFPMYIFANFRPLWGQNSGLINSPDLQMFAPTKDWGEYEFAFEKWCITDIMLMYAKTYSSE